VVLGAPSLCAVRHSCVVAAPSTITRGDVRRSGAWSGRPGRALVSAVVAVATIRSKDFARLHVLDREVKPSR